MNQVDKGVLITTLIFNVSCLSEVHYNPIKTIQDRRLSSHTKLITHIKDNNVRFQRSVDKDNFHEIY